MARKATRIMIHASDFDERVAKRMHAMSTLPLELPDPNYSLTNTCGCSLEHPIRRVAARLVTHPLFGPAIIAIILLNGFTMALETPGRQDVLLERFEHAFLLLFTAEMLLKLTSFGWSGYIRDKWNVLDFAVVLSGWAPLVLSNDANLSGIRLLRLLRIATLVRRVESMRHVVGVLFASLLQARPTEFGSGGGYGFRSRRLLT